MAKSIHPVTQRINVHCTGCDNKFTVMSTLKEGLSIETCNKCHHAYTGKRRLTSTGAVEKFAEKYKNFGRGATSKTTQKSSKPKKEDK